MLYYINEFRKSGVIMIWAISDIHGMYENLISLLKKIKDNDKIIFLGDYVDRGPDSKKVLDLLIVLSKAGKHVFLKGNHDDMLVDYYRKTHDYDDGVWFYNGAITTIKSFENKVENEYVEFLERLPLFYEEKIGRYNYLFVHAGVNPGKPLSVQNRWDFLWIREEFLYMETKYENYIILHGHTPTLYLNGSDKIIMRKDKNNELISIDIDTGCVYGGKLTALGITEDNKYVVLQA